MKIDTTQQTASIHAIEAVEIHFAGGSLPSLNRWTIRYGAAEAEITALPSAKGGSGRRFHWNLPLMALCLALLRLETNRGHRSVLLTGGRGSAAEVLAECLSNKTALHRLRAVLPCSQESGTPDVEFYRWLSMRRGPDGTAIYAGERPPRKVLVHLDGIRLSADELDGLASKLEWMTEERDWLGSVVGRTRLAAVA